MKTWRDEGVPANIATLAWARSDAYAADIVKRNGKYYSYASGKHAIIHGMSIGVAVADSPAGPYADARGLALVTNDTTRETPNSWDDIDSAVFDDDDRAGGKPGVGMQELGGCIRTVSRRHASTGARASSAFP